ncbi:NAD(P)/FAD-dependent oxidoreductase [Phytoactinopolyspora limicola]|uniref:NAD(P)/FAD-dependent oxidoreductase n=1 Tax=Phytoactinopolyspora limicola TaxID=2715536 RepID=UPI001A9C4222|nr:NAD(P)/FAD-dependent oxidoreductase [Phytoactinopolyspora limicola]
MNNPIYDAVIVGGGPAGMSAALTLARVHRSTVLLDAGHGRNAPTGQAHNFWTRDGTPPEELRRLGRAELAAYPTVQMRDGAVVEKVVGNAGHGFQVELADGAVLGARRILLATGLTDDVSGLPGAADLWGRSAFHCPYCHGYECTGKPVAVVGSEPARIRLALQLSRFASDVVLCTDGAQLDPETRAVLEAQGLAVNEAPLAGLVGRDGVLERIEFTDGPALARDAVFVQNVAYQASPLAEELGCAVLPDGCVEVNEYGQTSVPGIYAAGDMAHRSTVPLAMAAVVAAAASGTVAGSVIDQDLLSDEFDLANPFALAER